MRTRQRQQQRRGERRPHAPTTRETGAPERVARQAAGTQDQALYACGCGHAFQAGVSTTVACPRCGSGQAW